MARLNIATLEMPQEDVQHFLPRFRSYMQFAIVPNLMGVNIVEFHAEVGIRGGFDLIVATNRILNETSRHMIRSIARGFIGGWKAQAANYLVKLTGECGKLLDSVFIKTKREAVDLAYFLIFPKIDKPYDQKSEDATIKVALRDELRYESGVYHVTITPLEAE